MATLQRAQTGNRVYNGVGQAPNIGQVSASGAQGYLQRELRKRNGARPVGGDGKSDRRSGVAARALGTMFNNPGRPVAAPASPMKNKNKGTGALKGNNQGKGKNQGNKPKGIRDGTIIPNQPMQVPQVTVNANGILELPYNQDLSMDAWTAVNESNNELLALQQEEQEAALQAMQARRDAEVQYNQLKTETESSNAGRGALYSSMHGKNVADNVTNYSNTLADISAQQSQLSASLAQRRAAIQTALNQQLSAQAQQYGHDLGENEAGNLGYGQAAIKPGKNKNQNKNKNKGKGKGKK